MWRVALPAGLLAQALLMEACVSLGGASAREGPALPCEQRTPEVFVLQGETNVALAACVASAFRPTTRELLLDSPGGNVDRALDIAAHFEGRGLTMRVVDECNSSCANYFLPLAGRIIVEPEAIVMLHGSLDPALRGHLVDQREAFIRDQISAGVTRQEAQVRHEGLLTTLDEISARQAGFAARNGVPSGWLLYRRPGSDEIEGVSGAPDGPVRQALIVEEAFMRSCLRRAQIEPYDARLGRGPIGLAVRTISRLRGFAWSGEMRCTS